MDSVCVQTMLRCFVSPMAFAQISAALRTAPGGNAGHQLR